MDLCAKWASNQRMRGSEDMAINQMVPRQRDVAQGLVRQVGRLRKVTHS